LSQKVNVNIKKDFVRIFKYWKFLHCDGFIPLKSCGGGWIGDQEVKRQQLEIGEVYRSSCSGNKMKTGVPAS